MVNIWLDDVRTPPEGWIWVKNYRQAIKLLEGIPASEIDKMSLDHDLGYCGTCEEQDKVDVKCDCVCHLTGYNLICWMEANDYWPAQKPTVHSANPVGRKNMMLALNRKYGE